MMDRASFLKCVNRRLTWQGLVTAALMLCFVHGAMARQTQEIVTPRGISVWLVEDHGIPLVAMSFAIRGGSILDPSGKDGAGSVLASMLGEGAGDLDSSNFKRELETIGSRLSFSVSYYALTGSFISLKRNVEATSRLLELALREPRFDPESFERVRKQGITFLTLSQQSPRSAGIREFNNIAFENHPYSRSPRGTIKTLGNLTIDDVHAQFPLLVSRTGLHVVFVGAIKAEEAIELVDSTFGDLPERVLSSAIPPIDLTPFDVKRPALEGQPEETAIFGLQMPDYGETGFFSALLLNYILGSGNFDARLTEEIRVKRGLTYSIATRVIADRASSISLGAFSTDQGRMDEAIDVVNSVYLRFAQDGPTALELENAKSGLNGAYLLSLDTSLKIASNLVSLWIEGQDADFVDRRFEAVNAVTLDMAKSTARQYFDPRSLALLRMQN